VIPANAPQYDRRKHDRAHRLRAAAAWHGLLVQEEHSRLLTRRLVGDLERAEAPADILALARRVASDEERHVELCAHVVRALGMEPRLANVQVAPLPADDGAFERSLAELLVAGFAVAETMSVGGFAAGRALAREPLMRWALTRLTCDEVRHGEFGERAAAWALSSWSPEARCSLWPACVGAMLDVERRAGGPLSMQADLWDPTLEALGAPSQRVVGSGLLRAVPRWVLPRMIRLRVISGTEPPPRGDFGAAQGRAIPAEGSFFPLTA
jgi:hypothetical protein